MLEWFLPLYFSNFFSYSISFAFPYKLYNNFVYVYKKKFAAFFLAVFFIKKTLNLYINLERIDIFIFVKSYP